MRAKLIVLAALATAVLLLAGCKTEVITSPSDTGLDTVTSAGSGKALAAPDTAELTFGITSSDPKAKPALDRASRNADAVSSALQKAGVKKDDIQTSGVRIEPTYAEYREGQAPRVVSYRAYVDLRVRVRDVAIVGDVIEAATGAGASSVSGPTFTLEDDTDAANEAITDAVDDARARAGAMAKAAGKKVGDALIIRETSVEAPPIYNDLARGSAQSYALDAAKGIEPGQLDITANITVVFRLE
ncbi:DUF541 domain-containing protein [bacterium]|nr:DUF541 domain-containing protein [bacterium]